MRLSTKSLAAVATLTLGAVAAPMAASAQSYGYSQNYGTGAYAPSYDYGRSQAYDPCARERQGRTGAGALVGGGAGAVIGSQLAARGRRTEGSILGGVVGALIGSQVGRSSSDACRTYQSSYGASSYYSQGYGEYDDRDSRDQAYRDDDRRDDYAYNGDDDHDDRSRPVDSYQNSDGCRLAESQIRLPDGRTDTRYVRTCPDQYGRYRVVD
ncbi:glycine zipper 2TM domain-containing protein [Brevundimonas sp. SL130]|uniref:glycine zipper 2TM domain-containing protein n=1 Tax=Brevundimonas sp. SL130 TaxID=2995143 RepID=UPI00226CFA84|nr:glycine zipper 2TM domain-containing protein [Brevundimonas sp. SL130]WAC58509.1 glycine zipper 2TM domain-containing protein [Brevundimonas sp. SL130]